MKRRQKIEDPWKYATYEGVEWLQVRQTARMTLTERLKALDDMISLARGLHMGVKKSPVKIETPGVPSIKNK
jgi:hypothetical protein